MEAEIIAVEGAFVAKIENEWAGGWQGERARRALVEAGQHVMWDGYTVLVGRCLALVRPCQQLAYTGKQGCWRFACPIGDRESPFRAEYGLCAQLEADAVGRDRVGKQRARHAQDGLNFELGTRKPALSARKAAIFCCQYRPSLYK